MIIKPILTGLLTIGVLMSVQENQAIAQPAPQVLLAGNPKASSDWIRFTSRKHGFTALMPGNSKISDRSPKGKKRWSIDGNDSDTTYRITYFDSDTTMQPTEATMHKFVNYIFKGSKMGEVYRSSINMRGYPGMESSFRLSLGETAPSNGRMRFFFVGNRLYMVMVINRYADENKIAGFLQSFELF